jgi:hypothetical protein
VKTMMSRLSIDEEPGPKTTNPEDKHEGITPDEEATKQDQAKEETQAMEATATGMANTATFARS